MKKTVLLRNPSVSGRVFSLYTGEVCFTADFRVGDETFSQVPFLRLIIEGCDGDQEGRYTLSVDDEYCHILPYLKPIADFRHCFRQKLMPLAMESNSVRSSLLLEQGLRKYDTDLLTFSDDVNVIRQAKSAVNILDPKRKDSIQKARAVLEVLGKTPNSETPFSME